MRLLATKLCVFVALFAFVCAPVDARPDDKPEDKPEDKAAAIEFQKQIAPILKENCLRCHGEKKAKGKLRLHTGAEITKAKVIVPGKPEESELYRRIILPEDHDDIMPPSGDPLSKEDQEAIKQWILAGANFGAGGGEPAPEPKKDPGPPEPEAAPPADALEKIRSLGALVLPLYQGSNLISVDFRATAPEIGDEQLKALEPVAQHVTRLNLARTKVTDSGLAPLAKLSNLERLHLEKTGVGDAALAHVVKLPFLRYLNVYGTKVTDAGLGHVKNMAGLRKLYLWQTGVTYAAYLDLKSAREDLRADLGWDHPGIVKERLTKNLAAAAKEKEEAAKREEDAKKEKEAAAKREEEAKKAKEAAAKREEELKKKLDELSKPAGDKVADAKPPEEKKEGAEKAGDKKDN